MTEIIKRFDNLLPNPLNRILQCYLETDPKSLFVDRTSHIQEDHALYIYNKKFSGIFDKINDQGHLSSAVVDLGPESLSNIFEYQMVTTWANPSINNQFTSPMWFALDRLGMELIDIYRIKTNISFRNTADDQIAFPHFDHPGHTNVPDATWYSLVYYIHDSDGDTILFDKHAEDILDHRTKSPLEIVEESSPKSNSAILFNSNRIHSYRYPVVNQYRSVINCVFLAKPKGEK